MKAGWPLLQGRPQPLLHERQGLLLILLLSQPLPGSVVLDRVGQVEVVFPILQLLADFMQWFRTQKLKTPPQKNSKSEKGFSANASQRTLTHKRTSSTAMQDGSLFALVTWESRPGHLHDACRAPHGSTTRRWVMCKHQGSASLSACGTTYAGNAKPTSGSSNNPRNTTDTQQERRFLLRASRVRHGGLQQSSCATQRIRSQKEDSGHAPAVLHREGWAGNFAGFPSHACCSNARCMANAQQLMLKTWTSARKHTKDH